DAALPPADWLVHEPGGRASIPEFADFLAHHEPISGRLTHERLQRLFGQHAGEIRSAAVMPLGELGLLAIGSKDPDHFQPGMGTVFLKMIAATGTAGLARTQDGVLPAGADKAKRALGSLARPACRRTQGFRPYRRWLPTRSGQAVALYGNAADRQFRR